MPKSRVERFAPLVAVALGIVATGPALAIDKFFPGFGNEGYDVQHYTLDIDATANKKILGKAKLDIKALETLRSFELDLHALKVKKVTLGGRSLAFEQLEGKDKLKISLDGAYLRGETFSVEIDYAGVPDPLPDPTYPDPEGELPLGWLTFKKTAFVVSEPVGASSFFPVNDEPTDKATYLIRVTVPKGFTGVSNGMLREETDLGSTTRFTWAMTRPMTSWLATINVNKFEFTEQKTQGIPLRYYTTSKVSDEELGALKDTPNMIDYISGVVGPYPFASYGSVVVDDPALYYALETQAMSTFPSSFIDVGVVAHELAHQWFGDSVSVKRWEDLWLAEGFATYFEYLYQLRDNPSGFDSTMRSIYNYLVENEVGPAVVSSPYDLFADNTYYRGSVTLYALQLHVGDRMFFKIIRSWYSTYRDHSVTSQDFIDLAVQVSGDGSVRQLLNKWLYKEPVPPLDGSASQDITASRISAEAGRALIANHKANRRHRSPLAQ